MSPSKQREYLLNSQYQNAVNLNARIQIHTRFSTNPYDWFRWIFDHFPTSKTAEVLELGCGPGNLWLKNKDRIHPSWKLILTDFSTGMMAETKISMSRISEQFHFSVTDAHEIPYSDAVFDIVIANHMLYHVADRKRAFSEIQRVLKPGGFLFATTVGTKHMEEIFSLGEVLDPRIREQSANNFSVQRFNLENGEVQLSPYFSKVEVAFYPDSLKITEASPLVDYILSIIDHNTAALTEKRVHNFRDNIQEKIESFGSITVTKSQGLFIATL